MTPLLLVPILAPIFRILETIVETLLCLIGVVFILATSFGQIAAKGSQSVLKLDPFGMWTLCHGKPFGDRVFTMITGFISPYAASMNFRIVRLDENRCEAKLFDRPWLRNPFGCIHAVALTNLGETTSALLVYAMLQRRIEGVQRKGLVTKVSTTFIKKARGTITAIADEVVVPTKVGVHVVRARASMVDSTGAECATFEADWNIRVEERAAK